MFKGTTLRDTDSTEELRLGDEEAALPRSALGHDIEFGDLDKGVLTQNPGGKRYSVSVVAGWEPSSFNEVSVAGGEGIKTTTVVTQQVSFAGMLEEEAGAKRLADKGML
jgi:hypothetical protein